jgi:rare lipoprotein A
LASGSTEAFRAQRACDATSCRAGGAVRLGAVRLRPALALVIASLAGALAGCASGPKSGLGGRDGPPSNPPANLGGVPDAEPRIEAIRGSGGTSKPYTVLGRSYVPITHDRPFRENGLASWYGRQFHSQATASGEPYDMYAMTAAHKTLPLPSYVRVRNPANGREAIVRVNDRGPFHDGRIIDLSYTAALKLDLLRGVGPVEIERITNEDIRTGAWRRGGEPVLASAAPTVAAAPPAARPGAPVGVPAAWTADAAAAPSETQPPAPMPASALPRMVVTELPPLASAPVAPEAVAPVSASAEEAPGASPAPSAAGFWVQLGAFRERGGADGLRAQAARGLPELASQLRVFSDSGTHRLQAGPFATREAALGAAAQVREDLRITPMVVERR